MNGTVAPLVSWREPTTDEPAAPPVVAAIEQVVETAPAPAVYALVPPTVPVVETPLMLMKHAVAATLEVPVFCTLRLHVAGDARVQVVTAAETCAELVNDPKRPNTNPAMAMAAMRVIAMRMTVASTGEMAFLFLR